MGCANGEGYEMCKSSAQSPSHHSGRCVWSNTDGSLHCLKQPWRNKSPSQNRGASASITAQTCISEEVNIFSIMAFITFAICTKTDIKQLHNYEADQLIFNNNNRLFKAVGNKELNSHRTFQQNLLITTECREALWTLNVSNLLA